MLKYKVTRKDKIFALIIGTVFICLTLWNTKVDTNVPIEVHVFTTEVSEFKLYISQADETGTAGDFEEIILTKDYIFYNGTSDKIYTSKYWVFIRVDIEGEQLINIFNIPTHSILQPTRICEVDATIKRTDGQLHLVVEKKNLK